MKSTCFPCLSASLAAAFPGSLMDKIMDGVVREAVGESLCDPLQIEAERKESP